MEEKETECHADAYRYEQNYRSRYSEAAQAYRIHVKKDGKKIQNKARVKPTLVIRNSPILRAYVAHSRERQIERNRDNEGPIHPTIVARKL